MPDYKNVWEVYKATDGWRVRVSDANGEVLLSGEAYADRRDAEHVVDRFGGLHDSETYQFALVHDAVGEPEDDQDGPDCG